MQAPPPEVTRAFGVSRHTDVQPLPGGQGSAWRAGEVVLKPVGMAAESTWVAEVFDGWADSETVRVPRPVRASDNAWVYAGWAAHRWVEGRDLALPAEIDVVRRASDAFHDSVAWLPRPTFLDERSDPWSYGDRVAWQGAPPQGHEPTRRLLAEGLAALRPVESPSQVIHGDIGGNVLVADGLPPAVIDWPPYFRPAGYALAVAAGDATCWSGAPLSLLDAWSDVADWDQLLLRAVIYRVATRGRCEALGEVTAADSEQYVESRRPSLQAVLRRLS